MIMHIDENNINHYIESMIADSSTKGNEINVKYHHNTDYKNASSIIKYGILSINSLNKIREKKYGASDKIIDDSQSHINGIDGISLSAVLDDLYDDEEEYDPFSSDKVDFTVRNGIKAFRNTTNYGNEFICYSDILPRDIVSCDIRLLDYMKNHSILDTLVKYNYLLEMCKMLKETSSNILLREMSDGTRVIDYDKLSLAPTLSLIKRNV